MAFVTTKFPTVNTSEGMAGTMKALVAYTAIIEGIPNMMAVFKLISLFLYFGNQTVLTLVIVPIFYLQYLLKNIHEYIQYVS